jgi:hypothetical protein
LSGEIDWAKVTEMSETLDKYTERKLARLKVFNPKELARKTKDIREIEDEDLGTIRYVLLGWNEANEIVEKHKGDNKEIAIQMLFKQLAPAHEGLTIEDVRQMPYEVIARVMNKLQDEGSFFPKRKTSSNGSAQTAKPR